MLLASVIFSGWNYVWIIALVALVAVSALFWSYRTAPPGAARWICPLLKAAGLTALALCLLEPLWTGQHAKPGANLFAVVADNSQGLQIHDRGQGRVPRDQAGRPRCKRRRRSRLRRRNQPRWKHR